MHVETRIVNLEQKSKDWLNWRNTGIGGSDIDVIIGTNPYKSVDRLLAEKCGDVEREDLSHNLNVQRGDMMEPIIRAKAENLHGLIFEERCYESIDHPYLKYSSDGVAETVGILFEAKSPKKLWAEPPAYYMGQIQYGMLMTKTDECLFCWQSAPKGRMCQKIIAADDLLQEQILEKAHAFWKRRMARCH